MFAGKRCREPLKGIAKIDKRTIAYADNKLKVIKTEIKEGRFDYATHFPDSKRAALFSGWGGPDMGKLVTDGVKEWLAVQEKKKATSTFRGYKSKAQHVLKKWPHRRIADVPKSEIELFQADLLNQGLSPKTVNDTFTVVRGVWSSAFEDGIIRTNPLDRIPNVERDETDDY